MNITTIGLDIAKKIVFQLHGVDVNGNTVAQTTQEESGTGVTAGCCFLADESPTIQQEFQCQKTVQFLKPMDFVLCRFIGYLRQ